MARNLIKESSKVSAGEYRIKPSTVGDFSISFTSPDLIPRAMKSYISKTNKLFYENLEDMSLSENIYEIAAQISYNFVAIHPFPDFNGRMSRLILTMVLNVFGIPFPIILRGDKKGKKRYSKSLKMANKNNIIPFASLIAMRTAETFQELDNKFKHNDLPSILHFLNE